MTGEAMRIRAIAEGPISSSTDPIRDAIASRSQRLDAAWPRAVDLEARAVALLHGRLTGLASQTCGPHVPEHWRAMLRGERPIKLGDLCRLATEPTRETRAAAVDALAAILAVMGYRLEAVSPTDLEATAALAEVARTSGQVVSEMLEDIADGQLSSVEAANLLPDVDEHLKTVTQLRATVARKADAR